MSDEDSKFSFSERTRVDEGDASGGEEDPTPQDVERPGDDEGGDLAGKTGVLSSNELKEAGILDGDTPADLPAVIPGPSDSQTYEARTMMLDPSASGDATVAEVAAIPEEPESEAPVAQVTAILQEADSDATVAEVTAIPEEPVEGNDATVALTEAIVEEPEPLIFRLVPLGGPQGSKALEIQGTHLVVGRHADCDLVIADSSVSRRHFELNRTDDGYRLKDLGSGNGTLIDGEPVTEVLLTHGMAVEAGMSRFQWEDPRAMGSGPSEAEKTQMIDIAQLQRDPSYNPNRRPQATDVAPAIPERAAPEPRRAPETRRAGPDLSRTAQQARPSSPQLLQWAGLATLGALAIVGVLSLTGLLPGGGDPGSEEVTQSPGSPAGAAVLMQEGLEAYKAWRWADARRLFEAARDQAVDKASANEAIARVAQEELASVVMEAVRGSMEANRYKEAIKKLGEVPDTSVYFGDAKALINDAKEGIVSRHLDEARTLAKAERRAAAIAELDKALLVLPEDPEVVALKREYQEEASTGGKEVAKSEPKSKRRPSRSESSSKRSGASKKRTSSRYELEPEWPDDPAPAKAAPEPLDIAPALAKYSSGKFSQAKKILDRVMRNTDSDRQRKKAKRLLSDITAFQRQWETGQSQAASENLSGAISSLKRAKALDKGITGAYKRRIDRLLADQYATQANNAVLSGNDARAGKLARKALNLSSGQSVARSVMNQVREKADGWLKSAESQLSSNPDRAKKLLTQVLAVFPKGDRRYARAYDLLRKIDAEDDD